MKAKLSYMEFYITNHCNLNCDDCNRFNNYNFSGHYHYEPYLDTYRRWAELFDVHSISIIGGEPLMHPNLEGWARTIRELWPNAVCNICSNGTLLLKYKNLYNILKKYKFTLSISVHNYSWTDEFIKRLDQFYPGEYSLIEDPLDTVFFSKTASDNSGVTVRNLKFNAMHQSAVYPGADSQLRMHNSDPLIAHAICDSKSCHHMMNGKLYKCGVEALIHDFSKQFDLNLDSAQKSIVESAVGTTVEQAEQSPTDLFKKLSSVIPHCTLCPEKYIYHDIAAKIGKTKIPIISMN